MKGVFIFIALLHGCMSYAQDTSGMVRYFPGFKFKDGFYLSFENVKKNNPVPKSSLITTIPNDNPDFYEQVLNHKSVFIFDRLGAKQEVQVKNLWGYARNGVLYIHINEGYFRITIIGSICHFVASQTEYDNMHNSYYPYYGGYPYYGSMYSPYYYPHSTTSNEMRQYLLDFTTGRVFDYDVKSLTVLLMEDPVLHDEYVALSNRRQKLMKFYYIRKFNERNPLYFPKQ
jgi:hypothetical protein